MTRLLRFVALLAYLFGGYLIGRLVLIPVFAVAHVDKTFESVITIAAGVVGAISGLGWFNAKFALPAPRGGVHGSGHFASADQIKGALGGAAGLIVGRENRKGGQLLRYAGQAHLLTIAPTRSGKGVGAIIPNLLTADRSVLCVDPKGENARHRREGEILRRPGIPGPVHSGERLNGPPSV
jgi:type IV secretion system protein VirD4